MPRYTFDRFTLDAEARTLFCDGEPVAMAGKTFDTLAVLVLNHGRLMDKDELLAQIWPGVIVEEANLSQSIFTVRKILGDSPKDRRFIATVAGRGYQFVAPVTVLTDEPAMSKAAGIAQQPVNRNARFAGRLLAGLIAAGGLLWFVFRPQPKTGEFVERRLTFNSNATPLTSATLSRDGKYLAYSDASGIHVRLLSTSEERLLPLPSNATNVNFFVDSWFPNGTELLVHSDEGNGYGKIWAVSTAGQSSRELRADAWSWDISPDGMHIVFCPKVLRDAASEIWVMDNQGHNARKVLTLTPGGFAWWVHWSPDGARLAYVRFSQGSQLLETCDLKGADRKVVVDAEVRSFAWLPDLRIVYSQGEAHDVEANLWQVGVGRNGKPAGKPKRITRWAGSDLHGLSASADGKRLILRKDVFPSQVLIGELTSRTGLSSPRQLTHDEAASAATAWTADSQTVLLVSNRNGKWGIFKQGVGQDTPLALVEGRDDLRFPHLSPDGAWVLYVETPAIPPGKTVQYKLMRVPVNGGPTQLVFEGTNWNDHWCARTGLISCVVIEESPDNKQLSVTAFDPMKGKGQLLRTITKGADEALNHSLSPDGSILALTKSAPAGAQVRLLSLTGSADRAFIVKGWPNATSLEWSADGKALYCGSSSSQGTSLLRVDMNGTAQVLWQSREVGGDSFLSGVASPDGRYLAITTGTKNSNAWMLEGF